MEKKDLSFIIPVRIDNNDRINNLSLILRFLNIHFRESEIIIIEDAPETKIKYFEKEFPTVRYILRKNNDRFSRALSLNAGARESTRDVLVSYDLDTLIDPKAIMEGLSIIEKGAFKIVLPHNKIIVNVKGGLKERLFQNMDISSLGYYSSMKSKPDHPDISISVITGTVMIDRKTYLQFGGFNKKMISYGWEDIEMLKRFAKIGFYPYILGKYNVIHLDHMRGEDSVVNSFYQENKSEFLKINKLPKFKLLKYISEELRILPEIKYPVLNSIIQQQELRNFKNASFIKYQINRVKRKIELNGNLADALSSIILKIKRTA